MKYHLPKLVLLKTHIISPSFLILTLYTGNEIIYSFLIPCGLPCKISEEYFFPVNGPRTPRFCSDSITRVITDYTVAINLSFSDVQRKTHELQLLVGEDQRGVT